ncbi:hypothetical protein BDQ94DRAFT_161112 [Aspergillus welwitschiae]|uniref:Uncharacterized protein n=1 Tax=Aspergillus welwitschiae TaxID=1341132 RepID=A0A3F3PUU7_9EURO|nr:hypothetical protein BDQ94DRAFT_161112 [Aspergillus welwitschiae]RDH30608.1 hypothetical protein BDQ94DRAFT_161112 [Aspergillus welwitschiae]
MATHNILLCFDNPISSITGLCTSPGPTHRDRPERCYHEGPKRESRLLAHGTRQGGMRNLLRRGMRMLSVCATSPTRLAGDIISWIETAACSWIHDAARARAHPAQVDASVNVFSGIREPKGKFSRMVPNQTLSSSASHSEHNNYSTITCWIKTFPRERLLIISATSNWTLFPLFVLPFNCWIDMTVRSPSLDGCRAHTKTHRHSTRYWERDAKNLTAKASPRARLTEVDGK